MCYSRHVYHEVYNTIMNQEPERIQLQAGYYFSPGFYMQYWRESVLTNYEPEAVAFNGRLKLHREAWIGAQLAAMKSKLSGEKYYFALPESDPPDVLIGTFTPITTPRGRAARNLDWFPVENTRCDMSEGETLIESIQHKNTLAYENTVLLVYLQGADRVPDTHSLHLELNELDTVYLHEIIVMVQIESSSTSENSERFGFVQVYPTYDSVVIDRNDPDAYFVEPNIIKVIGRGVRSDPQRLASIILLPPENI